MSERIIVEHPNGYKGILYGARSMSIINADGKEVLHTGFRNINTKEELYTQLSEMPDFLKKIAGIFDEEGGEDNDSI